MNHSCIFFFTFDFYFIHLRGWILKIKIIKHHIAFHLRKKREFFFFFFLFFSWYCKLSYNMDFQAIQWTTNLPQSNGCINFYSPVIETSRSTAIVVLAVFRFLQKYHKQILCRIQSTETGCMFSASFLSSWNRTDDKYLSPKLGWIVWKIAAK